MGCIAASRGDVSTLAEIVSAPAEIVSALAEIASAPAEPVVKERLAELMKLVPEEKIRGKVPLIPDFNTDADVERSVDELRAMGLTHIERTEYIVKPSR